MNGFDSEYLNILNNVFNDLNFYQILKYQEDHIDKQNMLSVNIFHWSKLRCLPSNNLNHCYHSNMV